jgi:hypothetical protein
MIIGLIGLGACTPFSSPSVAPRTINVQQTWQMQPGTQVSNYSIVASLGDVSIDLGGDRIYAPFDGLLQPQVDSDCLIFSSPEVPSYLLRLCGVKDANLGEVKQGDSLGTVQLLHFATLRKQPDGRWALVEPARDLLERLLQEQSDPS